MFQEAKVDHSLHVQQPSHRVHHCIISYFTAGSLGPRLVSRKPLNYPNDYQYSNKEG